MTLKKLAQFIVDQWYSGSPYDEPYQIAVEQEIKHLKRSYYEGKVIVIFEVEDK